MLQNFSAKNGSLSLVTSVIAALIDFSRDSNLISSPALTNLSPKSKENCCQILENNFT